MALSICPLWSTNVATTLTNGCAFDFYLAVPILEGHAHRPWLHTSFNRNRGQWVSAEGIRRWAEQGIQTVHCHNDGDYYEDGLFWRDGSYPPYPDMDGYDKVLQECRRLGIRTATYFSNKELHPTTREFQAHGAEWGRKNRQGDLRHNFFRGQSEFGAQMCLRSGWLDLLKLSIDRVLKNHPLDGVYYDWNVALVCGNPLHEAKQGTHAPARCGLCAAGEPGAEPQRGHLRAPSGEPPLSVDPPGCRHDGCGRLHPGRRSKPATRFAPGRSPVERRRAQDHAAGR